jgi:hypothetical protein
MKRGIRGGITVAQLLRGIDQFRAGFLRIVEERERYEAHTTVDRTPEHTVVDHVRLHNEECIRASLGRDPAAIREHDGDDLRTSGVEIEGMSKCQVPGRPSRGQGSRGMWLRRPWLRSVTSNSGDTETSFRASFRQ